METHDSTAQKPPRAHPSGSLESRLLLAEDSFTLNGIPVITINFHLATLQVQSQDSASNVALNSTEQFSARSWNQFGIPIAPPALTWSLDPGSVGNIDPSGLFHSGATAGSATIRVSAESVTAAMTLSVDDVGRPTIATPAAASLASDRTFNLSVLADDDGGEAGLTYTWSALTAPSNAVITFSQNGTNAAKNAAVTLSRLGDYTLQVSASDGTRAVATTVSLTADQSAHWYINSATGNDAADGMSAHQRCKPSRISSISRLSPATRSWPAQSRLARKPHSSVGCQRRRLRLRRTASFRLLGSHRRRVMVANAQPNERLPGRQSSGRVVLVWQSRARECV